MFAIYFIHGKLMDRFDNEADAIRCFDAWAFAWNVTRDGKAWLSRPTFTPELRAELLAKVAGLPYVESPFEI